MEKKNYFSILLFLFTSGSDLVYYIVDWVVAGLEKLCWIAGRILIASSFDIYFVTIQLLICEELKRI